MIMSALAKFLPEIDFLQIEYVKINLFAHAQSVQP